MTIDEFIRLPWQNIAGFVGFLIAITILFSKWIPGARQLTEAMVTWLGGLFTADLGGKVDKLIERFDVHIADPDAHSKGKDE